MIAFDQALDRLIAQLRKDADRRKRRRGGSALADLPVAVEDQSVKTAEDTHEVAGMTVDGDGPVVVREKTFGATRSPWRRPGPDGTGGPRLLPLRGCGQRQASVVYRRKAYDLHSPRGAVIREVPRACGVMVGRWGTGTNRPVGESSPAGRFACRRTPPRICRWAAYLDILSALGWARTKLPLCARRPDRPIRTPTREFHRPPAARRRGAETLKRLARIATK